MNILKAFLLTALLIAIELSISLSADYLIDTSDYEVDSIRHYIGLLGIIPYSISFSIILFLIYKMKIKWDNGIEKARSLDLKLIVYLLLLIVGLFFFDRPYFDFTRILDTINNIPVEPYSNYQGANLSLFYKSISVLIVAPIFEELFFRKYIFTELTKKYSLTISILISSICFSLIHLPSYRNLIPTFILGVISCLIYSRTRNIIYTVILHFLLNLIWLIALKFGANFYNRISSLEFNYVYWSLVLSGILIVFYAMKKIKTTANTVYN